MTSSPTILTGVLARALEAQRVDFNVRFKQARQLYPNLKAEDFAAHLRETVAPIVEAVAQKDADRAPEIVRRLYDLSLDLCGRELLGGISRHPVIKEGWQRILPVLPHLVAAAPEAFAGTVTNALYNLSLQPSARPAEWIETMLWLGPNCPDVNWFMECGKVAAWRCGMAHYRESALEACAKMDAAWARTVLGVPPENKASIEEILRRLQANPWLNPTHMTNGPRPSALRMVAAVGGFRGFGGPFITPPDVVRVGDRLVVFDTEGEWFLHADVFGATFLRTDSTEIEPTSSDNGDFKIEPNGAVRKGKLKAEFPELAGSSSYAAAGATLAVTIPLSHKVFLVAETETE